MSERDPISEVYRDLRANYRKIYNCEPADDGELLLFLTQVLYAMNGTVIMKLSAPEAG